MSASPRRRAKRAVQRAVQRAVRKRNRNVVRMDTWIRRNPNNPMAVKLKAMRSGIQVVQAEDMIGRPRTLKERAGSGERVTRSGLILPPEVKND